MEEVSEDTALNHIQKSCDINSCMNSTEDVRQEQTYTENILQGKFPVLNSIVNEIDQGDKEKQENIVSNEHSEINSSSSTVSR